MFFTVQEDYAPESLARPAATPTFRRPEMDGAGTTAAHRFTPRVRRPTEYNVLLVRSVTADTLRTRPVYVFDIGLGLHSSHVFRT